MPSLSIPSNRSIVLAIGAIAIVILTRLFVATLGANSEIIVQVEPTMAWIGFFYSALHVLIVGIGTYYCLKT